MSKFKIVELCAVVADGKETKKICLSDLVKYIDTCQINKITQPGNPMAQTPTMYGYQIQITTNEPVEVF